MSLFTMINRSTKEIGEELFFENYMKAGKFCKDNYSEGWEAVHEPFTFGFKKFLKEGTHKDIFQGRFGPIAIKKDDVIYECGKITVQEYVNMKAARIKMKSISKREFLIMHNKLVECQNNGK